MRRMYIKHIYTLQSTVLPNSILVVLQAHDGVPLRSITALHSTSHTKSHGSKLFRGFIRRSCESARNIEATKKLQDADSVTIYIFDCSAVRCQSDLLLLWFLLGRIKRIHTQKFLQSRNKREKEKLAILPV
jgi:hypothetical protein